MCRIFRARFPLLLASTHLVAACASGPLPTEPSPGEAPAAVPLPPPPEETLLDEGDRAKAEALVLEGRDLRARGEHARALATFAEACDIAPDSGIAHLEWAVTAQFVGVPEPDVRARFVRVLALLPDNPRAHFERAVFEEAHGDRGAALDGYRRTVALRSDQFEAHLRLGALLLEGGEVEGAFIAYERAASLDVASFAALLGLAEAAERKNDLPRAERALLDVIARFPDVPQHRLRLIAFYQRTGQLKKARAEQAALERRAPKDERRLRTLKPSKNRRR